MNKKTVFLGITAIATTATALVLYNPSILDITKPKVKSEKQTPNPKHTKKTHSENEDLEKEYLESENSKQETIKNEKKKSKIHHEKNYSIIYLDMDSSQ